VSDSQVEEAPVAPKTRSRAATRAKLLEAASEVFAEVGLGEASVERICERAGFTRGAFYSNFSSKDEMFLELAGDVARDRVAGVRARMADIVATGGLDGVAEDPSIIIRVLDVIGDDPLTTLLAYEISIRAMRDPEFAAAYREHEQQIDDEIVQLIDEIVATKQLRLRVSSREAARIILAVWADVSARAAVSGLGPEQMAEQRTRELSRVVALVLEPA